jgi:hypothetical protein
MIISQPSNLLINHLGLSNFSYSYNWYSYRYIRYTFLNLYNITLYLQILFKSGFIYTHHLFYHIYYFQLYYLITLPVYITEFTFPKFYRWHRIKSIDRGLRKEYLMRNYLKHINLSAVFFYHLNRWLIVSIFVYRPPLKKFQRPDIFTRPKLKLFYNKLLIWYRLYLQYIITYILFNIF